MSRDISEAEMKVRADLAACYRLVELYGMGDGLGTHISARVPDRENEFLLNPYGLFFDEIDASSLVRVNMDGEITDDSNYQVNKAGFTIHSAILGGRPDINCALHTHTVPGMAVSSIEEGLLPLTQHAMRFHKRISYHDYEGVATRMDECERLQADLGPTNKAMILRNHGLLTCGETVGEAFQLIVRLEKTCEAQIQAMTMAQGGATLKYIDEDVAEYTAEGMAARGPAASEPAWAAHLRRLDKVNPGYKH